MVLNVIFYTFISYTIQGGLTVSFYVHILLKIISGTFGQVLECLDNEKKEIVAIKVVRSIQKYREAAMIEIDVLQKLSRHDVGGKRYVLFLFYTFQSISAVD